MELRIQNSEPSTRKNYQNNDTVVIPIANNNAGQTVSEVQSEDHLWISFSDQGILSYSNCIDHNLIIEPSLSQFQFWRCVFRVVFIKNTKKFYLIHDETNLYMTANAKSNISNSSIFTITLTEQRSKYSEFEVEEGENKLEQLKQDKLSILYDHQVCIKNSETFKFLQVTKQNRFPHLAPQQQTKVNLKLYRKDKVCIQNWIVNQPVNYLQNGDLVLLQNAEKTQCLILQPKNELFFKNADLNIIANSNLLEIQNYTLVERPTSQIKNFNMIYALWRVCQTNSFIQSNNSLIYNRDTIVFRHCFTNICLIKSWSGQNSFSSLFDLGRDSEQGPNTQNCAFHVRNKINYSFSEKNTFCHQPLFLQSLIELDHKFLCNFQKIDYSSIRNLRMFNQSIVSFSQSMMEFISSDRDTSNVNRRGIEMKDQKSGASSHAKRTAYDFSNKNPREMNKAQLYQVLSVDYEKLKEMVKAYNRIEKILVLNHYQLQGAAYSSFYVIKIATQFLEVIGSSMKGMSDIKRRKKPIMKPLIFTIYQYLINVLRPEHFNFSTSLLSSLKKLIKIDDQNTILMIYYVSRMWNLNNAIDIFIQIMPQVQQNEEQLILACIFDIVQHSNHWKREQSLKIKEMFSSLGIKIKSNQPHGLTLSNNKSINFSILDFDQQDRKLLYYIKIAVFSEAYDESKIEFSDKQVLITLITQLLNERSQLQRYSRHVSSEKVWRDSLNEHNLVQKIVITLEVINYYLLSLFDCTISTLKNRRFVILNSSIDELYVASNNTLRSDDQFTVNSHLSSIQESSSASLHIGRNTGQQRRTQYRNSESTIKQNTNVYWFINYERPEQSISTIAGEIDHLLEDLKGWDSLAAKCEPLKPKIKIFTSTPKLDEDSIIDNEQNDIKKLKKSSSKLSHLSSTENGGVQGASFLTSKQSLQHLCFMLQVFNILINTTDIVLSAGYTTIKTICTVEEFALQITLFICSLRNRVNHKDILFTSQNQFQKNFPRTANELVEFYNDKDQNKGMLIQFIVVEQKIGELLASINELFEIILMLKKRLIVHPAIETTDRWKLFNFQFCLAQCFALYAILCNKNNNHSSNLNSTQGFTWGDIQIDIVTKMLNFYGGFSPGHNEEIIMLNMPTELHRAAMLNRAHVSTASIRPENEPVIHAFNQIRQCDDLVKNYEVLNMHTSCFQGCEQIVYHLQMLMLLRDSIDNRKHMSSEEISTITAQMKELLDLISRKLVILRSKINTKIQLSIMRAYEVSEKLVQSVFSTVYFQYDFILNIVIFLCQNPPQFHSFSKLHDIVTYSLPLAKIFLKSLHRHLEEIIRESTVYSDTTSELKQAIFVIVKVIESCHKQLSINQFVLIAGVICEIFPNRVVSEKIYHILLEGYTQDKMTALSNTNSKALLRKLIFNAGYKDQVTINKRMTGIQSLQNEHNTHKLTPSSIVSAFKTLDTFKALVTEAQREETKHAQKGGYNGDSNNFTQLISSINKHISLIFRLCENSDEINRHFTQNIIKYDSLMLIAFDNEIPLKYKIPLPMYFRNDARIYDDQLAIGDYLAWISSVLKDHEFHYPQLTEYISQSSLEYEDFHHHSQVKFFRQRQFPKVSLLIDQMNQRKQQFGTSSVLISSANAKIMNNQCYYWYLLFSRPFLHKEEGILILLEQIISNLKQQFTIKKQSDGQKDTINKSISQIYDSLVSLYRKLAEMLTKIQYRDNSENDSSISNLLLRKIKKNLKLIFEKYPSFREISIKDIRSNQNIAHSIAQILINNNLLKKFIKIFYYNEYKNIDLSIFCDKKRRRDDESDTSEQSSLTFKHSRSSKMSQSGSKDSFRIAQMAIMKLTRKDVSIKYFDYQEDEGCRSNQALVLNGERNIGRRSTYLPSTIKENNNHLHYFEERAYMFYEVSKLLARVCQLVQDPTLKSKLEEEFIMFFQAKGTSKILKYSIVEKLKFRRQMYLKQFSTELVGHQQNGLIKQLQWSPQAKIKMNMLNPKQIQGSCLMAVIKNLLRENQMKMMIQFLKSVWEQSVKQKNENFFAIKKSVNRNDNQMGMSEHFLELEEIFKSILIKSAKEPQRYTIYLPVLKYLLLVFLSPQKTSNSEVLAHQSKISGFLADFINNFLFIISKFYEKEYNEISESGFERQFKRKKQTIITHVARMRNSNNFTNYKMPDREQVLPFRKKSSQRKEKVKYMPDLQVALYQAIDLYAIVEARTTLLQKQIYEIISTKILKMVYGMTLTSSLKLILKCLLQKCELGNNLYVPNIINSNQKLQHFVWSKIREVNDNKNLMSSNMAISENLSFISIFYDYLYSLYWDFFNNLYDEKVSSSDQLNFQLPKLGGEIWQAICYLQQNVARLLLQEKAIENSTYSKFGFINLKIECQDKGSEDHQRFCLLHKILSQSINLFNMKLMTQNIEKQANWLKRTSYDKFDIGQEYIIENFSTFIENRKMLFNQSSNQNLNEKQIETYKLLYSNLRHLQIKPCNTSRNRIMFSYVNENLSCRYIYKCKDEISSGVYFYKKYRQDWNNAIIDIVADQKATNRSHQSKVNKVFSISEYVLAQIKKFNCFRVSWNNQLVGEILLGLQILLTLISLVLIYMNLYDKLDPVLAVNVKKFNTLLLKINLALLFLFCANKLQMFWKIQKLKVSVQNSLQPQSSQLRISKILIMCRIIQNNFSFTLSVILQIMVKVSSLYMEYLVPMQLFAIMLYFVKQSAHNLKIFFVCFRGAWILLLLCLSIIWLGYYDHTTRIMWIVSPENNFGSTTFDDAEVTKFIKKLSGRSGSLALNWFTTVIQNALIIIFCIALAASVFSQLHWSTKTKEIQNLNSDSQKCIICKSINQNHIAYVHNVNKLIDLIINLKMRTQSSLTCVQIFLQQKIQSKDLSVLGYKQKS